MHSEKTVSANSQGIVIYYGENNKHHYMNYDFMNDLQIHGTQFKGKSYQESELQKERFSDEFTILQNKTYKRVLYGLSEYTEKEISTMKEFEKNLIGKKQKSLWIELNKWKNEVMNNSVNRLIQSVFFNSELVKDMATYPIDQSSLHKPNRMSFHQLGLDKLTIAHKLVQLGFLPADFFIAA
jgi:hypothetical protein